MKIYNKNAFLRGIIVGGGGLIFSICAMIQQKQFGFYALMAIVWGIHLIQNLQIALSEKKAEQYAKKLVDDENTLRKRFGKYSAFATYLGLIPIFLYLILTLWFPGLEMLGALFLILGVAYYLWFMTTLSSR